MSKKVLLAGFAALAALFAPALGAMAQDEEAANADSMWVYVGNLDVDLPEEGDQRVEVPLEVAAEACGVDLEIIRSWARSEPRQCVALHRVDALDEAIEEQLGNA